MRHFLLISALVWSILLLSGVMDRGALFSSPTRDDVFLPRSAETPAGQVMERVLASLSDDRVLWLETAVRQKMFGEDAFDAEGRYLLGPDQRMRLELRISTAGKTGRVLVVSDGDKLRQGRWLDGQTETATDEALPLRTPQRMRARREFLEARGLGGLRPLLRQIGQSLQDPVQRTGLWQGRPALEVSGAWNEPEDVLQTLPPGLRARRCHVVLDAETLWPYRVEWLGAPRPLNYPVVLLQMDFRDPVINRPLSPSECGRAFRFSLQ
jgi:hypothetical protein